MALRWIFSEVSTIFKYKDIITINPNSHNNLPNKIKDVTYEINFDEYADIGSHWVSLCVVNNFFIYFIIFIALRLKTF